MNFYVFVYRLWGCAITPFSCVDLSSALSSNQNLITLDLGQNSLGYSGIKMLCDALKLQNCPLQTLRYDPSMPHNVFFIVGFGGAPTTGICCKHLWLTFSFCPLMCGHQITLLSISFYCFGRKDESKDETKTQSETKGLDLGLIYMRKNYGGQPLSH